jgi:hypothetical protein
MDFASHLMYYPTVLNIVMLVRSLALLHFLTMNCVLVLWVGLVHTYK